MVNDNYGYDPERSTEFDPTVSKSFFGAPRTDYPNQQPPRYTPMPSSVSPDNQPTAQGGSSAQPVYVPYPVVVSGDGDNQALTSLILGIVSAAIGWIPVCGAVALIPAIIGIVFGGLGFKSQRRRGMALAGIVLSALAIAMALVFFI